MFKCIVIGLSAIIFVLISNNQTGSYTAPLLSSESIVSLITTDDITYEFKYLSDKTGKNYAGEYYLKNNTDKFQHVRWSIKGGVNINVQTGGDTKDVPPFTKVWIATIVPRDAEKFWDPGTLQFVCEPVK
jgi:hypothetical protein